MDERSDCKATEQEMLHLTQLPRDKFNDSGIGK
jgi:hypothetical protein